jgi:uncharacterized protein YndB with AHSA1/START domain
VARLLKAVAWGVAVLIGLALLAVGIGFLLPAEHTASAERVVAGSPESVWAVITDIEGMPHWRPGVISTERLSARDGLDVWRESGPTGSMTIQVTASESPERLVTRIADQDLPFGGTWTYELRPAAEGHRTRITLIEDGEIYNPFFRFVARFILGYEGTMEAYLDGLETRMEERGG